MNQENKEPDDAPNGSPEQSVQVKALFNGQRHKLERFFKSRVGGSREDIRELVQEVYARLLLPPKSEVPNWEARMWRIALNLIVDRGQQAEVRRTKAPLIDEPDEDHRTPETSWGDAQAQAAALRAIDDLPEPERTVLTRITENQSLAQIACELGVSERHCRRIYMRGIVEIRRITGLGRK